MNEDEALWERVSARRRAGTLGATDYEAWSSAEQNADDTSVEQGFALFSPDWYRYFAMTFESMGGSES